MSYDYRDYYATLGVSRDATPEQIKQAFRKLARKYHPDVAADQRVAEEKFKEINEAHEVLSDPEKRRKYDDLAAGAVNGHPSAGGWNGRQEPPGRGMKGKGHDFHFDGTGFSDFFEQFFGGAAEEQFGATRGFDHVGDSGAPSAPQRGHDIEGDILVTFAEVMRGTTRPISLRTFDPVTGAADTRSFSVRVPPGAVEGRRIRVPGKGEPGVAGGEYGDLFLRVRYAAHPDFRARDSDLYYDLDLAPWEAVLGAQVVVPSLDGPIKVRVPPGTSEGRQLRVRRHGLPKGRTGERGDLHVVTHLQVPQDLSEEDRALWEKLAQTSQFRPRRPA